MLRARLLRRAAVLIAEIHAARESGLPHEEPREGTADDAQAALQAAAVMRDREELREIQAALRRMDESVFGKCTQCGCALPLARLDALPEARRCVNCEGEYVGRITSPEHHAP